MEIISNILNIIEIIVCGAVLLYIRIITRIKAKETKQKETVATGDNSPETTTWQELFDKIKKEREKWE